jgi:hypothetical protein
MARTRVRSTRHFEVGERTRGESRSASSRAASAVAPETGDAGSAVFPSGEGTDRGGSDEPTRDGSFSAFAASDADATGASGVVAVASEAFVASRAVASANPDASEVPASLRSAFPVIVSIASSSGYAGARRTRRALAAARGRSGTSGASRTSPRVLGDARADVSRTSKVSSDRPFSSPTRLSFKGSHSRGYLSNCVHGTTRASRLTPQDLPRRRRRDDDATTTRRRRDDATTGE